jgi:hypothetical protein
VGNGSGVTRIITGVIMADNGDGTFVVDLDDDGVGVAVVRAPTVRVGQIGTVLDTEGAQVLIGPRVGDDQPTDALQGLGSFETWVPDGVPAGGITPEQWTAFWSTSAAVGSVDVAPYSSWVADGVLAARCGIPATAGVFTSLLLATAIIAPAQSMNLRVRGLYKPVAAQAGNIVQVLVFWGTTDAQAQPFGGGKTTTAYVATLTSATGEVAVDVTCPMPVGAYTFARVYLIAQAKASAPVAGSVVFDGWTAEWLETGTTDTPWVDWTPDLLGSTTAPNPGTAASGMLKRGRYTRQGTTVRGWGRIDAGTSGVSAGSGNYGLTLPVAPRLGTPCHAPVIIQDSSSSLRTGLGQKTLSGTAIAVIYVPPVAFSANGDTTVHSARFQVNNSGNWFIEYSFQYEAALPDPV